MNAPKFSLQEFAARVCEKEGGKINLPITEVMEVLRCSYEVCKEDPQAHAYITNYLAGLRAN